MDKTAVAELFKVKEDNIEWFSVEDTFNRRSHTLEGWMCKSDGPSYGSMVITKINEEETSQVIYSTPKLNYPFDKNGNYHFPKAVELLVYNKYDGTNIISYAYIYKNEVYVTYKTRLTPVVKNSGKFGAFKDMLEEMLFKYKVGIETYVKHNDENLSFELYGGRNKHLIVYKEPLDLMLLFR